MAAFSGTSRRARLRQLRKRDVITTRDGWLVDLAAPGRLDAVRALASDPSEDVDRALLDALADPLDEVRAEVVSALAERGSRPAVTQCAVSAASWDPVRYPLARAAAWDVLGEQAHAEDLVPLVGALLTDAALTVDDRALASVRRISAADPDAARDALSRVLRALDHDHSAAHVRAHQLGVVLAPFGVDTVAAVLRDDRRAPAAARILGETGDLGVVPDLVAVLRSDRTGPARAAAASALGMIGGHDAARALRAVADDPDPVVRRAATEALAPLAGLTAAMEHEPPSVGSGVVVSAMPPLPAEDLSDHGPVEADDGDDLPAEAPPEDHLPEDDDAAAAHHPGQKAEPERPEPVVNHMPAIVPRPTLASPALSRNGSVATLEPAAAEPATDAVARADGADENAVAATTEVLDEEPPTDESRVEASPELQSATVPTATEEAPIEPDRPDAPWLTDHPPVPAGPPPRPRGARRPRRSR